MASYYTECITRSQTATVIQTSNHEILYMEHELPLDRVVRKCYILLISSYIVYQTTTLEGKESEECLS